MLKTRVETLVLHKCASLFFDKYAKISRAQPRPPSLFIGEEEGREKARN